MKITWFRTQFTRHNSGHQFGPNRIQHQLSPVFYRGHIEEIPGLDASAERSPVRFDDASCNSARSIVLCSKPLWSHLKIMDCITKSEP
jgi:hypothetical protein